MNQKTQAPSLLLIGGPKTGKTHYGGQLLRRLQRQQGRLHMIGVPSDLSGFQEVCDALAQGKSAPHTPVKIYRESVWRVSHPAKGIEADLVWPDYGGEQVERLTSQRQVPEEWRERIRTADGWMLFIRLSLHPVLEDMLTRPRTLARMQHSTDSVPSVMEDVSFSQSETQSIKAAVTLPLALSAQANFIELLQTLLFVKQVNTARRIMCPPLFVILSCWDELLPGSEPHTLGCPAEVLQSRLPLLFRFIEANWETDSFKIMGLSAQGKPLDDKLPDEDFIDNGPERQGYCVLADGTHNSDLTLLVADLLEEVAQSCP